jgi:hypothetical protein
MVGWAGRWPVESVRVEVPGEEEEARRDAPEKVPGLATGLTDVWRRRTGARRQITRLVVRWYGSSTTSLGEERRGASASRAKQSGEADGEKGKQVNLASSRAGAEDIGEREGVVHVEATPHGRHVEVARRRGCAWRTRLQGDGMRV